MKKTDKSGSLLRRRDSFGLVFLTPWLIGFLMFFLYPFLRAVLLSLQKVTFLSDGGFSTAFIGVDNYLVALTKDEKFLPLAAGSILDLFINVPVCLIFSFFVAVLLRQKFRGNSLVKAMFFLPVILGTGVFLSVQTDTSAVSGMALDSAMQEGIGSMQMLQSMNLVNILQDIGIPASVTEYITGPVDRIYNVISLSGVQIFIFLAGLNAISPSVYLSLIHI